MGILKTVLTLILGILNPLKNDTNVQKAGSLAVGIAIAAAVVTVALQVLALFPPAPPSSSLPDVINGCTDAGCPVPSASPDVSPLGDIAPAGEKAPESVPLAMLKGAVALLPLGCSAAQNTIVAQAGGDLAACLLNCGASAGSIAITQAGQGARIDGAGIGYGVLGCAMPCLLKFGVVSVTAAASPGMRYGGSAGEADVYQPDKITITVMPR